MPLDFWSSLVILTLNAFHRLVLAASFMTHSSSGPFTMDSSVVCLYFLLRDDNAEPEISLVGFVGVKQSARGPRTSLTFGFAQDLVELPTSSERMGGEESSASKHCSLQLAPHPPTPFAQHRCSFVWASVQPGL